MTSRNVSGETVFIAASPCLFAIIVLPRLSHHCSLKIDAAGFSGIFLRRSSLPDKKNRLLPAGKLQPMRD
jgi:hypothetical protein